MLSAAETLLRNSIMKENRFRYNGSTELVLVDADGLKAMRTIMQTISDYFNGTMAVASSQHDKEISDLTHAYELRVKDLERIVAVFEDFRNEELRIENARLKAASIRF